jgi:hypothetical protein
MSNAWAVIEEIEAGRYEVAFPNIKPTNSWPVHCFSIDYNRAETWDAFWEMKGFWDVLFYIFTPCIRIRGIEIELTKSEKKALAKALEAAQYNEVAKWKAHRKEAKYDPL